MKERSEIYMKLSMIIIIICVLMDSTDGDCPSSVNCPDAPYHITQPSTDNDVQIVSPTATSLDLRCSLNSSIPVDIMITWSRGGDVLQTRNTTDDDTVTNTVRLLLGGRPQPGVYQCVFNYSARYILRRNITVLVIQIVHPSMDFYTVSFNESTSLVQLMCSLNINISSNVIVTWLHNDSVAMTTPPNGVLTAGNTTTLTIRNIQPSDAGIYQCVFNDTFDEWILTRNIGVAPYRIIQPSTNDYVQTVFSTAINVTLNCSLSVNIPANMTITWLYNDRVLPNTTQVDQTTNTVYVRLTRKPQDGVYQCVFNDPAGYILRRSITLLVVEIVQPPANVSAHTVTFDESTSCVQLMCSLNINISSNVMVTWMHNGHAAMIIHPNKVITNGDTTTLLIVNLQSSDDYQCVFTDTVNGWTLSENFVLQELSAPSTATTSIFNCAIPSTTSSSVATTSTDTTTILTATSTRLSTAITFTTATTILSTITTLPSSSSNTTTVTATDVTDGTSTSSDVNVVVIVAPIIIIIVIALVVVALIIAFYWWRRKKQLHNIYDETINLQAENPYYSTVKSGKGKETSDQAHATQLKAYVDQQPCPMYAVPDKKKKEKRKSTELRRSSVDFSYKPQRSPEMSVRSRKQTLSLITPDSEHDIELDIYAAPDLPERTEASTIFDITDEDNPIYSETINPSVIIDSVYASISDNDSLCPYASIYADPLPLTKSEGPPIVSNKNIEPLHQLGTGQFGEVILANTVGLSYQDLGIGNSNDSTVSLKVAVKTLKASPSEDVQKAFEKEIKFMSRLKDDNVVRLLGICTTGTPFIMMEYMENGDLNNYLQQFEFTTKTDNPPTENEIRLDALVYMSFQIASGMNYLSSCKFIHRDLAARNILVGADNSIKIADFGMSQNLYSAYYYKVGGRICLPIRWMAYECFFGKFSVKTDVWAFGITLWEIFTLCRFQPFGEFSDQQMIQDAIKGSNRKIPYQPDNCPNDIYNIMKSCFHHEPSERAGFNILRDQLNECYSNLM